jgi:hypothetical protein
MSFAGPDLYPYQSRAAWRWFRARRTSVHKELAKYQLQSSSVSLPPIASKTNQAIRLILVSNTLYLMREATGIATSPIICQIRHRTGLTPDA